MLSSEEVALLQEVFHYESHSKVNITDHCLGQFNHGHGHLPCLSKIRIKTNKYICSKWLCSAHLHTCTPKPSF